MERKRQRLRNPGLGLHNELRRHGGCGGQVVAPHLPGAVGYKCAAPALPADRSLFRQFLEGLADLDLTDAKAPGNLGFVSRPPFARFDHSLQDGRKLVVKRYG